ncbi:MAG: lipase maturation factor family protein [Candidatus Marinamargulisbacteria bacterium]
MSTLLIVGLIPFYLLIILAIIYYSLISSFSFFLNYQWDILFYEILILSLFLFHPKTVFFSRRSFFAPLFVSLLPMTLLMVRLFYHSALVKVMSRSFYWLSFRAIEVHLFSQPLPHWFSYSFLKTIIQLNLTTLLSYGVFIIEFIVPFALLIPKTRRIAALSLILFQFSLILTGNFGFFNFLVMVPLILCFLVSTSFNQIQFSTSPIRIAYLTLLLIFTINSVAVIFKDKYEKLPLSNQLFASFRLFNHYGLFARMTDQQMKFNVYLRRTDSEDTYPIFFKYYDDNGYPDLTFLGPYMPRIRWQLWFKFLSINHPYPNWMQIFMTQALSGTLNLPSFVRYYPTANQPYDAIDICYTPIMFDLDAKSGASPWTSFGDGTCHSFTEFNLR